jgi:hypothetical protein
MKKEARLLKAKAISSLVLCIDHFNRQWDIGRTDTVLILLDHAFEMLLKAAILEKRGRIRDAGEDHTYTFEKCVRIGLSDGAIRFLTDDQTLTLQTINGLRDAAQHHIVDLSEGVLYIQVQSGTTLFRDLLLSAFGENLRKYLPERALPVATIAPLDPISLFAHELDEVRKLLRPKTRKGVEAKARLRGLAILDGAISGEIAQPGERRLRHLTRHVRRGGEFEQVFPGISAVNFVAHGNGVDMSLRLSKREGLPVHQVPEGQPGGSVIAVKRVNELDFYCFSHNHLACKVGLTPPKLTAVVRYLNLKSDPHCFKDIVMGKSIYPRFSQHAIERVERVKRDPGMDEVWEKHKPSRSRQR